MRFHTMTNHKLLLPHSFLQLAINEQMASKAFLTTVLILILTIATAVVLDDETSKLAAKPHPAFRRLSSTWETLETTEKLSSKTTTASIPAIERQDTASPVVVSLHTTEHQSQSEDKCRQADVRCMSNQALEEVNKIRSEVGLSPLKAGTVSQLDNAVSHSKKSAITDSLVYQKLLTTFLGCESSLSGENFALRWMRAVIGPTNVASLCVKQFKDSPLDYENMVSTKHEFFVMGVYLEPNGKVWCTQTFAVGTKYGSGKCAAVSKNGDSSVASTEKEEMTQKGTVEKMDGTTLPLMWKSGGPCGPTDTACMSEIARRAVNRIRSASAVAPLKAGTISQLDNAIWYSKKLSRGGRFRPQYLQTASLGCGSIGTDANHAQSWVENTGNPSDVALMCVQQFKRSKFAASMISKQPEYFVLGVYIEPNGKVWCTQTFSVDTKFGSGKCAPVPSGSVPENTSVSTPKLTKDGISSTGYVFNYKYLNLREADGTPVSAKLECDTQCEYCYNYDAKIKCITESYSIKYDKEAYRLMSLLK